MPVLSARLKKFAIDPKFGFTNKKGPTYVDITSLQ